MFIHPSRDVLARYADDELPPRKRADVAKHLLRCRRCRERVEWRTEVARLARELPDLEPPAGALDRILERHAAGDRAILPIGAQAAGRPTRRFRRGALAAVLAAGFVVLVILGKPAFEASRSELIFAPAEPRPRAQIEVEYRGPEFGGQERVVLRARYRTAANEEFDESLAHHGVAELRRQRGGTYRGSFRLPDSVVYAAFAVEDADGRTVVSNHGRLWELLAHGDDGRPLFDALEQRRSDLMGRNWREAYETARRMVELYPEQPMSWLAQLHFQLEMPGEATREQVIAEHEPHLLKLHERLSAAEHVTARDARIMLFYSMSASNDRAFRGYWSNRLTRDHRLDPNAVHIRTWQVVWETPGDTAAILRGLERLWNEVGPVDSDPANHALGLAMEYGAADEILKWAERAEQVRPFRAGRMWQWIGSSADEPAVRRAAIAGLRREIRSLRALEPDRRPLEQDVEAYGRDSEGQVAVLLATLGALLVREGEADEAARVFEDAARFGWNPDVFRQLAEARLALGDTVGSRRMWAMLAVDPLAGASLSEAPPAVAGAGAAGAEWSAASAEAQAELEQRVLADALALPLPRRLRLSAQDGTRTNLAELVESGVSVALVWASGCAPSLEQLERLQTVRGDLESRGIRVLGVAAEPLSERLARTISERGITLPVYSDVAGDVRSGLNSWATPELLVVENGVVRFRRSGGRETGLETVQRQALVLASRKVAESERQ